DANGKMPAAAICDKKGKPLLSWRVQILPYIEQDALYREFKLDEPWDSEHNKKLIAKMPRTYALPTPEQKPGETFYRVFVGRDAGFDLVQPLGFAAFTDGLSNTIMCVEAQDSVPWTKPEDLEYDAKKPLPKLGGHYEGGFNALIFDGSVRFFVKTVREATLRA